MIASRPTGVGLEGRVLQVEGVKMVDVTANPVYVALLCIARCLIPLLILFGISWLLRHFGVIAKPAPPPAEFQNSEDNGY
jgi:hypothetical protein